MLSVRNVILALPTLYLLVALYLMGDKPGRRLPSMSTVPQRVLWMPATNPNIIVGQVAAPVPAVAAPRTATSVDSLIAKYQTKPAEPEDKVNITGAFRVGLFFSSHQFPRPA